MTQRLWGQPNAIRYVKDAFHKYVISGTARGGQSRRGRDQSRRPLLVWKCPRGGSSTVRLRLRTPQSPTPSAASIDDFREADRRCGRILPAHHARVTERRPAAGAPAGPGGMLWSKQFYYFDLERWLTEHKSHPAAPESTAMACGTRNGSTC